MRRVLVVLLATVGLAPAATGGSGPATAALLAEPADTPLVAELTASPVAPVLGDEVTLVLTYRWPRDFTLVDAPDPVALFPDAAMTGLSPEADLRDGDQIVRRWRFALLAERSGPWALPQPVLVAHDAAGTRHRVVARAVVLDVDATTAEPDLAAASPLLRRSDLPSEAADSGAALAITVAALVVTAMAAGAWWWRRREIVQAPPEEVFQRDLVGLGAVADGKQGGALLSAALRRYCGRVFAFDGLGSTTREVDRVLRSALTADGARACTRLLERLDQLRWAPGGLAPSALKPLVDGARDWVEQDTARRKALEARKEAA